jgi:tetratricopeptide (TPR) repeat protein
LTPLDPLSHLFFNGIGKCHLLAQRNERALEWLSRALRERPDLVTRRDLAIVYARLGRSEEAQGIVRQVIRATPDFTITKWRQFTARREPDRTFVAEGLRLAGFPE